MTPGMDGRHIVVVGPMAAGKSTMAEALAGWLGRPLRDSDDDLTAERGITGRQLAEAEGVPALHAWEATHLRRSLAGTTPSVIAAAASVVDDPACREALGPALVVAVTCDPDVLAGRMAAARAEAEAGHGSDERRSLGADELKIVEELDRRRAPEFRAVADVEVDTGSGTRAEALAAAEVALSSLDEGPPTPSRVSHVGICVADPERALRFYRDGLGFTPTHAFDVGPEFGPLMGLAGELALSSQFLRRDGVSIELLYFAAPGQDGDGTPRPVNRLGFTHLSIRVADVDAAAARVAQTGGTVLAETRTTLGDGPGRTDFVYCTDPDGTRVELMRLPEG